MSGFDAERWRTLSPLLDEALERSGAERDTWLTQLALTEPALAAEVRVLLAQEARASSEGFLDDGVAIPSTLLGAQPSLAGQSLGPYTLDSLLGQGGMGSVWLAHRSDGRYEGRVAIKLLNLSLVGAAGTERFEREGSILARLSHPNIARILDAGVAVHGQPYLVLEHVDGEPIDRYCDERALDVATRVRLLLDVMSAVAHAHGNLILHRDLKASNILVTTDGTPKLLDFGIAKVLEDSTRPGAETALTRAAGHAFTPQYAAPEQIQGRPVTTATDVYALGVLLYMLLSGRHPTSSAAQTGIDQLKAVVETEPARLGDLTRPASVAPDATLAVIATQRSTTPQRLQRALRGDLENIVAKALKKDPAERYATVSALADDLTRYLHDEPVSARPDSLSYRAAKFVRRHRLGVAAASMTLLAVIAGIVGVLWQAHEAHQQRDRALRQLTRAEAANRFISSLLSNVAPSGKPFTSLELLARGEESVDKLFAQDGELRAEMLIELGGQYQEAGETQRAEALYERAMATAQEVGAPIVHANAACELATLRVLFRSPGQEQVDLADAALAELRAAGAEPVDEQYCLLDRSTVARQTGDFATAVTMAERALSIAEEMGSHYQQTRLRQVALFALASAYSVSFRFVEARSTYDRVIEITHQMGDDSTVTMALANSLAAYNIANSGATLDAFPYFERALAIVQGNDPSGEVRADLSQAYGSALADLGRYEEALAWQERGIARARAEGIPIYVARGLLDSAAILRERGELERAGLDLQEAEAIMHTSLPETHRGFAVLLLAQGQLALAHADGDAASELLERSVRTFEERAPTHPQRVVAEADLASALVQRGDLDGAEVRAQRALDLARTFVAGIPHSSLTGRAWMAIAEVREARGDAAGAREAFRSALEQLEPALGADAPATQRARAGMTALDGHAS